MVKHSKSENHSLLIAISTAAISAVIVLAAGWLLSLKSLLLVVGFILSLVAGILVYLVLRPPAEFDFDALEMLFQLAKDEKAETVQKQITRSLVKASKRRDAIFQELLEKRLSTLTADLKQLGKGRIEFANTESWRVFYEQLLRSPSTTLYRSVAHIETPHYWQDGHGQKSTQLNLELHDSGKVSIERIAIIADHLWPEGEAKPIEPIWRWIDQQHRYGIWFELVRESALVAESKLISDFGIYGFRAVGRQIADASGRTSRFTLSFEYEDVKEAESNWNRLRDFTISSAQILDRMG